MTRCHFLLTIKRFQLLYFFQGRTQELWLFVPWNSGHRGTTRRIYLHKKLCDGKGDIRSDKLNLELTDDPTQERGLPMTVPEIVTILPKVQLSGYYTEPRIAVLAAKERAEPGFCSHVKDFVVGRHGYGSIKFFWGNRRAKTLS